MDRTRNYAKYGQTLSELALPEGWEFELPLTTEVGNVGIKTFSIVFVENDIYRYCQTDITVSVEKAFPNTDPLPEMQLPYTFANYLGELALPTVDEGVWEWEENTSTGLSFGENRHYALLVPEDSNNYEVLRQEVLITVIYNTQDLMVRFRPGHYVNTTVEVGTELDLSDFSHIFESNNIIVSYNITSIEKNGMQLNTEGVDCIIVGAGEYYELVIKLNDVSGHSVSQYMLVQADDFYMLTFDSYENGPLKVNHIVNFNQSGSPVTRSIIDIGNGNKALLFSRVASSYAYVCNWIAEAVPQGNYDIIINARVEGGAGAKLWITSVFNGNDIIGDRQIVKPDTGVFKGSLLLPSKTIGVDRRFGFFLKMSVDNVMIESVIFMPVG